MEEAKKYSVKSGFAVFKKKICSIPTPQWAKICGKVAADLSDSFGKVATYSSRVEVNRGPICQKLWWLAAEFVGQWAKSQRYPQITIMCFFHVHMEYGLQY